MGGLWKVLCLPRALWQSGVQPVQNQYFVHVDGLRAISLLSVLLFHVNFPGSQAGFLGVDAFFVISGFLITRQLSKELSSSGKVDFGKFYSRRIQRLMPALVLVLICSTAVAAFHLPPAAMASYGQSLSCTSVSVSNICFFTQSGYFDQGSALKPLLHTWSLSVEEQFYLLWPLVLQFTSRANFSLVLCALVAGSLSVVLNSIWPRIGIIAKVAESMWYILPFRVYEFAVGASIYAAVGQPISTGHKQLISTASALTFFIYAKNFKIGDGSLFPSLSALPFCLAVAGIIVGGNAWPFSELLENSVVRYIGRVSYSVYLVHWPIIVFYKQSILRGFAFADQAFCLAASIVLGCMSYHFVEAPLRSAGRHDPKKKNLQTPVDLSTGVVKACLSCLLGMFFVGLGLQSSPMTEFLAKYQGLLVGPNTMLSENARTFYETQIGRGGKIFKNNTRVKENIHEPPSRKLCQLYRYDSGSISTKEQLNIFHHSPVCKPGAKKHILVVGNSHEVQLNIALHAAYENNPDVSVIGFGKENGCEFVHEGGTVFNPRNRKDDASCQSRIEALMNITKFIDVVFLSSYEYWKGAGRGIAIVEGMVERKKDIKVAIFGNYFSFKFPCWSVVNKMRSINACLLPQFVHGDPFSPSPDEISTLSKLSGRFRATFINSTHLLCRSPSGSIGRQYCLSSIGKHPVTYDKTHLSYAFAETIGARFRYLNGTLGNLGIPF